MRMERKGVMRVGGAILEAALGVFLVAILISAWNAQSSSANSSGAKPGNAAASTGEALLPLRGTPVLNLCLQDDSNSRNVVRFNTAGDYVFCCNGSVMASGVGTVLVKGGFIEIQHNPSTYRVLIKADTTVGKGTASLQLPPGVIKCVIADRNMFNNTCACALPD